MDFKKRLIEELKLSTMAANTMYDDYITACEKIAKEYHQEQVKNCSIPDVIERAFNAGRERLNHPDWDYIYEDHDEYIKKHGL